MVQKHLEPVASYPRNCEARTDLQNSENSFNHLESGELNHTHSPGENIKLEDVIVTKNLQNLPLFASHDRSAKITTLKIPDQEDSYTSSSYSHLVRHGKQPLLSGCPERQHLSDLRWWSVPQMFSEDSD